MIEKVTLSEAIAGIGEANTVGSLIGENNGMGKKILINEVKKLLVRPVDYQYNGIDANDFTESGCYYLGNNVANAITYSHLIVFAITPSKVVQFNCNDGGVFIKFRVKYNSYWKDWRTFTLT